MKPKHYLLAALCTIILGLSLRKVSLVPLWIGDALYAVMIYFGARVIFYGIATSTAAIIALCWCYAVECLQLVQQPWLSHIRQTLPGRLILGQGFLWSDLVAYAAGIVFVYLIDQFILKKKG
ncbi:ribosomal maturation YjgA family protein [Edaphocola flava]|uniref:ribosomal maturation YjgA family protein n=1 Tax=Edaphocola flava TaxID=2499629 RepID=UPI00100A357F|nr:DUF2809 domain-containing protein [Edaphocola flava]